MSWVCMFLFLDKTFWKFSESTHPETKYNSLQMMISKLSIIVALNYNILISFGHPTLKCNLSS